MPRLTVSEKRRAANRANSKKSCGPKTEAGKRASRANSFRHGLTGAGVVLPGEDAGRLNRRVATWAEEVGAAGDLQHYLVQQAALAALRLGRCARQEGSC